MRLQSFLVSALALAKISTAINDSSPLVLVSTSGFQSHIKSLSVQSADDALKTTKDILKSCPTDEYLIITQPGLNAADLDAPSSRSLPAPNLRKAFTDSRIKGQYTVSEVLGDVSSDGLYAYIDAACNSIGHDVNIHEERLASLSSEDRIHALAKNDLSLAPNLQKVMKGKSFTLLLLSYAPEPTYEFAQEEEPVRMDLRRHVDSPTAKRVDDNETEWDSLPLFEKYQFFTPAIFMGLFVGIILLAILSAGISALGSLEVPYAAFDKENGPAAQKKQQ